MRTGTRFDFNSRFCYGEAFFDDCDVVSSRSRDSDECKGHSIAVDAEGDSYRPGKGVFALNWAKKVNFSLGLGRIGF